MPLLFESRVKEVVCQARTTIRGTNSPKTDLQPLDHVGEQIVLSPTKLVRIEEPFQKIFQFRFRGSSSSFSHSLLLTSRNYCKLGEREIKHAFSDDLIVSLSYLRICWDFHPLQWHILGFNLFFCPVFTDAPSFAEPGDALLDKVANNKVTIPCPAEGTTRVSHDSALNRRNRAVW